MNGRGLAGILLLWMVATPLSARVERLEGVAFEHTRRVAEADWLLSGTHVSRWAGFLKVSVAALWLPADARGRDVLDASVGKQLEIHYLVDIPGERLRDGTREVLARNFTAAQLARERAGLDALVNAFTDVRAGDRYTLTHLPGAGVTLALNGRVVARAPRDETAAAIFAVWLGTAPLNEANKRDLLGYRLHRQAALSGGTTP